MRFEWIVAETEPGTVKEFLREKELPRRFISRLKFEGGDILVNRRSVTVRFPLKPGDHLALVSPDEPGHKSVTASFVPLDIVYEDDDLLIVNKPKGVVSIPSRVDPDTAMANRIKGYYEQQAYPDQVIHIVTRLDKNTTGLMMIAKHRLAHALMDRQIRRKQLEKYYYAISQKMDWPDHGVIDAPIARVDDSIITRCVDAKGRQAQTEFWVEERLADSTLLRLRLHTGRTHQIRVHLAHLGGPLIGDSLYDGRVEAPLTRQALHCGKLVFFQPLTRERIQLKQGMAEDMVSWIQSKKRHKE